MTDQAPGPSPIPRLLRDKLPELLIEACSVMFAVLLALAIDSWRERVERRELGMHIVASVRAEIIDNQQQLDPSLQDAIRSLDTLTAMLQDERAPRDGSSMGMRLALLSRAHWDMALNSQGLRELDFVQAARLARLYELQGLFEQAQRRTVDHFAELSALDTRDWPTARRQFKRIEKDLQFVRDTGQALAESYREALTIRTQT